MACAEVGFFRGKMCLVFDFGEKIILPHLGRKRGHLHFKSARKFDLFGSVMRNLRVSDIHCLPEGHRPGKKLAIEVTRIMYFNINKAESELAIPVPELLLHAGNCGGTPEL